MATLNVYELDPCCGTLLSKALRTGALDEETEWHCPKCGCLWSPQMVEMVRLWQPHPMIEVFRARAR